MSRGLTAIKRSLPSGIKGPALKPRSSVLNRLLVINLASSAASVLSLHALTS